ncbi:DUF742 domain-containing protein [Actinocatenispora rupis]|uniref:DUF742 domain-containing protein n=1 Tax=Actinocatenispora rupis TaxID=519421 RepID=A0A8J3NC58_9ACTN|nr:DUF742 domain-containing protein [Actinocatenispora rupis]GID11525.1 hypothetical protein Aru02nite_24140 [Actinocatenispora rupis]
MTDPPSEPYTVQNSLRRFTQKRGRAKPKRRYDVAMMVVARGTPHQTDYETTDPGLRLREEHRALHALCRRPCAVAEIAARLDVNLSVAGTLIDDLAELNLVEFVGARRTVHHRRVLETALRELKAM